MKVIPMSILHNEQDALKLNYWLLKFKTDFDEENYFLYKSTLPIEEDLKTHYYFHKIFQTGLYFLMLSSYLSHHSESDYKSITFQLVLIVSLILFNIFLVLSKKCCSHYTEKKSFIFEINYFGSCLIFILNCGTFQYFAFGEDQETLLTTIGLCVLVLLNTHQPGFNFRAILLYNITFCVFHGTLTLIHRSDSKTIISNLILYLASLYQLVSCYLEELHQRNSFISAQRDPHKKNDLKDSKENEEQDASLNLENCIEELTEISKDLNQFSREGLKKVIKSLKIINQALAMQNSFYENFSEDIDEEDKIYIMQSYLPNKISEPIKQKKFRQRGSLENIIEKKMDQEVGIILKQVTNSWNIDMFNLTEKTGNIPLTVVGRYCFRLYSLPEILLISELKLNYFLNGLEKNYKSNPYHNSIHAADVLSSGLYLIKNSELFQNLLDIEMLIVLISHLAHDVAHPGFNNRFLINFQDSLAMTYNDISVLENMHACLTFNLLKEKDKDILESLSQVQKTMVRKWVIDLILSTDMAKHFDLIGSFKAKGIKIKDTQAENCKLEALKLIIHAADIGHSAKNMDLHKKWSKLLSEEFFRQGDVEKDAKKPVSMYCDRETTVLSKSQIGFLRNIALPLYEVLGNFLGSKMVSDNCVEQLKGNICAWEFEYSAGKMQTLKMNDFMFRSNEIISPPSIAVQQFKSLAFDPNNK